MPYGYGRGNNMTIVDSKWRRSKNSSVNFYRQKMFVKAAQFNKIFPLDDYIGEMIGDKKEAYIADVGAGMFSTTGSTWKDVVIHLYPSDVLSENFNQMLKENNVVPVIHVAYEDMTKLSYPANFFDIVHCANALDHSARPMEAIAEMYRVCKPDGWIILKHFENVGEFLNYRGLHLWNIHKEGTDAIVWNQYERHSLNELYKEVTIVDSYLAGTKPMVQNVIKIHKV